MKPDLVLPVNADWFNATKAGTKPVEYRLATPYWRRRLEGRTYGHVVLTLGYPKKDDAERRMAFPWRGADLTEVTHPHFGPDPVQVFAIPLVP